MASGAKPVVAIIAQGTMGSGVARRLVDNGLTVLTSLAGRSAGSAGRAAKAGMRDASDDEIAAADLILSILPPGQAVALAQRLAPGMTRTKKPLYVDCNAIHPDTMAQVAEVVRATGCGVLDAGIIGGPPSAERKGPTFYASGEAPERFAALADFGLTVSVLSERIGEASALKMSYGAITKGLTALGAGVMLAASRAGSAQALHHELSKSQPALLSWLTKQMPTMYSKAYRWVDEMEEVSAFMQPSQGASEMFAGAAHLYEQIAADFDGGKTDVAALEAFVARAAT
jgi:putative dehydrogenase